MLDVERFLEDLAQQRDRYRRMVEATVEQNEAIRKSDMDTLLRIVKMKGMLLAETEEIERRTLPARQAWNEERSTLDEETVGRVEAAVQETKAVLQELLTLEEEGRALMETQKGSAGEQIRDMQKKKRVLDAYGQKKPPESRFYDRDT